MGQEIRLECRLGHTALDQRQKAATAIATVADKGSMLAGKSLPNQARVPGPSAYLHHLILGNGTKSPDLEPAGAR